MIRRAALLASLAPALAAAIAPAAVAGDRVFDCADGTELRYVEGPREMRISGAVDSIEIALPIITVTPTLSVWSYKALEHVKDCEASSAPCVAVFVPPDGAVQVWYQLDPKAMPVDCSPENQ